MKTIESILQDIKDDPIYNICNHGFKKLDILDDTRYTSDYILGMEEYFHEARTLAVHGTHISKLVLETLRKILTLGLRYLQEEDMSLEQVATHLSEWRTKGRDYSNLAFSMYMLRIEMCLDFARKAVVTKGGEKDVRGWIKELLNHGIACFETYSN